MTTMAGGEITLYLGPMFSRKTTRMAGDIQMARYANRACVIVKWAGDTRYSSGPRITTHEGHTVETAPGTVAQAGLRVIAAATLSEVALTPDEWVIGIDEGQFFPDLAKWADAWAREGRAVVVAALDGSFERKPFGQVSELIPLAEHTCKLLAVCMDCRKRRAAYTRLLRPAAEASAGPDGAPRLIGGKETYWAVCRACWRPPPA